MAAVATAQDIGTPQQQRPHLRLVHDRRAARAQARLVRERRVLSALVAVAIVAILAAVAVGVWAFVSWVGSAPAATAEAPAPANAAVAHNSDVYVVQPGDTLWGVAAAVSDGDPRPVVDELAARVGGAGLQPGQRIPLDGL